MTDRKIMQQALDALTRIWEDGLENFPVWAHEAAIDNLRERLAIIKNYPEKDNSAQPEQEPVAYAVYHRMGGGKSLHWPEQHSPDGDANEYQLAPLYTAPPQRKPPQFPTMLRKMWSGSEVQQWINENWSKT